MLELVLALHCLTVLLVWEIVYVSRGCALDLQRDLQWFQLEHLVHRRMILTSERGLVPLDTSAFQMSKPSGGRGPESSAEIPASAAIVVYQSAA